MDSNGFFGDDAAADPQGFDRYGRYMLDVDGTGKAPYTRATTIAKTLDDGRALAIYGQRKAAKGVAMSPALTARAAIASLDDKTAWREIIEQAEVKSGGDEKRDLGSAFHELHERVPTMTGDEWAAVPPDLQVTYNRYRAELDRLGIEEVLTECTVANTAIGTAGKADAVFRLPDGRLVIADRKSGRAVEYPHSPAVQLAVYANADVLISYDENGATVRSPMPALDRSIGIIVDITIGDEQTAAVHVYEIDLVAGWYGALLAAKVRRWRNRKDLIMPYHPEFPPAAQRVVTDDSGVGWVVPQNATEQDIVQAVGPIAAETVTTGPVTPDEVAAINAAFTPTTQGGSVYTDGTPGGYHSADEVPFTPTPQMVADQATRDEREARIAAKQAGHPAFSSAQQKNIMIGPDGNEVPPTMIEKAAMAGTVTDQPSDLADIDALLAAFKTKAQLQAAARIVDPTMAVNRTRSNLAKDMVSHPGWAAARARLIPQADPVALSQAYTVTEQTEVQGEDIVLSEVVSNAPGPVPPDPEPGYPAADEPPPPWMAQPAPTVPEKSLEDQFLERIAAATSTGPGSDLAQVWQDAQDAGIGWPPRLHQASTIKHKQLIGN